MQLAGGADLPAVGVLRPACVGCPGPVVGFPERGRVSEDSPHPAMSHQAVDADLVTDDTVPGDRNRMGQRVETRRLRRLTGTVWPGTSRS
jgi:hypothetical protein